MQHHFNNADLAPDTSLITPIIVFFENSNFQEFKELSKLNQQTNPNSKVIDPKPDLEPRYTLIEDNQKVADFQKMDDREL
jgi:hypothetical protein